MKQILLLLLSLLILIQIASATEPLSNFIEVTPIPESITPGDKYQPEYTFSSSHTAGIMVNYTIIYAENNNKEDKVNFNEWNVNFILNNKSILPNETNPGHFTSNEFAILSGDHNLNITVQSLPNILPGIYTFKITLLSEDIETITIIRKTYSNRYYRPTPVATTALLPTQEATITPTPPSATINITTQQTPPELPPNYTFLYISILIILLIAAILLYNYYKNKRGENNE